MTDRELLELAYRAYAPGENYVRLINDAGHGYWNPLTDDGDALRLAVKLGLNIMQQPDCAEPWVDICGPDVEADELYGTDPFAATRRAIVRAAAEIGRVMK
jgi:hypothetical protein